MVVRQAHHARNPWYLRTPKGRIGSLSQTDGQVTQLPGGYRGRGAEQQVGAALSLGEGNNASNGFGPSKNRHQPGNTWRYSSVGGCAVLERFQ